MAKTLTFTYEDIEYTLEFTRRTVKEMEKEGFNTDRIGDMPMTMIPKLFAGAFKAHHRYVKPDVIDKIYESLGEKEELVGVLAEMYNEPISTLLDEPKDEGKVSWKKGW